MNPPTTGAFRASSSFRGCTLTPVSKSEVLPATVTMAVTPLVCRPKAVNQRTEVLAARVSVGGTTQTVTPSLVR